MADTTPIGPGLVTGTVHGRDARTTVTGFSNGNVNSQINVLFRLHTQGEPGQIQVELRGSRMKGQLSDGDVVTVVKGKWIRGGRVLRAKTLWNHSVHDSVYVTIFRPREH